MIDNNIIVVTNEKYIVDQYLGDIYRSTHYIVPEICEVNEEPTLERALKMQSAWEYVQDGVSMTQCTIDTMTLDTTKILRIPFEGLVHVIVRDRYINNEGARYILVSIKEQHPTQLVPLELYDLYLDGRRAPRTELFSEWFEQIDSNMLLGENFDVIYNMALENEVTHMSEFTKLLLLSI